MRVVAGSAGGLRLQGPSGPNVRPTTDKVREAIFNSLNSLFEIEGASVLDLFAGTGACGIEALSRGAGSATFVDSDRKAIAVVRENLRTTKFEANVVCRDVLQYLVDGPKVDVAFVDPPYVFDDWSVLLDSLDAGVAVCESDRSIEPPAGWQVVRNKRYGDTTVTILRSTDDA